MLLAFPDLVLAKIAQYLPLSSAVDVAQACHRLRLAFPRALGKARAAPIQLCAHVTHKSQIACLLEWMRVYNLKLVVRGVRVTHESQLAYLLEWMRVYNLTLVVRSKDIVRIIGWLAGRPMARWARLDLTRCSDYVAIYRHMRRQGLIEHIVSMPKPLYIRFRSGNSVVEEDSYDSDPNGVEYDRMSRYIEMCRLRRSVIDSLVSYLGNVHTLALPTWAPRTWAGCTRSTSAARS
jgi:hypothetical protein